MNRIDFKSALLCAPLAYTIHHFEEHILFNFRAWRLEYFADSNPLSTELVFMILTGITLVYIILHGLLNSRATAWSMLLFLMASQVHNVLFHLGGTLFFWHFSPGLITALLLYVPVNFLIVRMAFREGWLTRRSLLALFLGGGIMFWAFEQFGPLVMSGFLIATYVWIGYEALTRKTQSPSAGAQETPA